MTDTSRLCIDKADRDKYQKLEDLGILKGKTRKEQFMFAITYAILNNRNRTKLDNRETSGFIQEKYLQSKDFALINSIIMYDNKDKVSPELLLENKEDVYRAMEEYAHSGIMLLANTTINDNFWLSLESQLYRIFKEAKIDDDTI